MIEIAFLLSLVCLFLMQERRALRQENGTAYTLREVVEVEVQQALNEIKGVLKSPLINRRTSVA